MSILFRAAVLGGIAYLITRSMSGNSMQRRSARSGNDRTSPVRELHPGENIWPTSESQSPTTANAGPSA
jgi:hypothetical protein